MSRKIKVMIADDSAVVRRILADVLGKQDNLELVFQAANGQQAVQAFPSHNPDVVVLDIEMPVMNGLETVSAIKDLNQNCAIIMFSSLTNRGAEATLEALSKGACDYETKPKMVGHLRNAIDQINQKLIPKIINWGTHVLEAGQDAFSRSHVVRKRSKDSAEDKTLNVCPDVIAIGSSTGGPEALKELLSELPQEFELPIVIVQHMPPVFTKAMAERLNAACKIEVREAADNDPLVPGCALIAPGDYHMALKKVGLEYQVELNQEAPENFCRPAVDVLFRSVSEHLGKNSLAVVLTGMGKDGLVGAQAIANRGGQILVQDEQSSAVWGMPKVIYDAGLAAQISPPKQLAETILNTVGQNSTSSAKIAAGVTEV